MSRIVRLLSDVVSCIPRVSCSVLFFFFFSSVSFACLQCVCVYMWGCCETNIASQHIGPDLPMCVSVWFFFQCLSFSLSVSRLLLNCLAAWPLFVRIVSLSLCIGAFVCGGFTVFHSIVCVYAFALLCSQLPMCVFSSRYNAHIIVIIYLAFVNRLYRKHSLRSYIYVCARADVQDDFSSRFFMNRFVCLFRFSFLLLFLRLSSMDWDPYKVTLISALIHWNTFVYERERERERKLTLVYGTTFIRCDVNVIGINPINNRGSLPITKYKRPFACSTHANFLTFTHLRFTGQFHFKSINVFDHVSYNATSFCIYNSSSHRRWSICLKTIQLMSVLLSSFGILYRQNESGKKHVHCTTVKQRQDDGCNETH